MYKTQSCANNDSFTSLFQIQGLYFFFFLFLIALSSVSRKRLNTSGESWYPCHVPTLEVNDSIFIKLDVSCGFVWFWLCFVVSLHKIGTIYFILSLLRYFITNVWWTLWSAFSASIEVVLFFALYSINMVRCIHWFVNWSLHSCNKPHLSRCLMLFICCWIQFTNNILLNISLSLFVRDTGLWFSCDSLIALTFRVIMPSRMR